MNISITMHLSEIFKFTEGLGQDGHQIGRKVGDALEVLTFGMVEKDAQLVEHLVVENGIEGATTAEHKVEFSFYKKDADGQPSLEPMELFGLIECKKVGVEQTINSSFKTRRFAHQVFYNSEGYSFKIRAAAASHKWEVKLVPCRRHNSNLACTIVKKDENNQEVDRQQHNLSFAENDRIIIAIDVNDNLHYIGIRDYLTSIDASIRKCLIIRAKKIESRKIKTLLIEDALCGPQTPEKAKQASFVSLDVRKKVLGHFDKKDEDCNRFSSILVVGEASHWEDKSRSMIRLCNDRNLIVPDEAIVLLFKKFKEYFGASYQEKITKQLYQSDPDVKRLTNEVIAELSGHILQDMDTGDWVKFQFTSSNGIEQLQVVTL